MGDTKTLGVSQTLIQGEIYHCYFVAAALKQGLIVEWSPVHIPWDFTITHPKDLKRVFRVQVKGTNEKQGHRYKITAKSGSKKSLKPLDPEVIDVAAFFVEGLNVWYNIPTLALGGRKSVWLYPHVRNSVAQYEMWRHDWSVFET